MVSQTSKHKEWYARLMIRQKMIRDKGRSKRNENLAKSLWKFKKNLLWARKNSSEISGKWMSFTGPWSVFWFGCNLEKNGCTMLFKLIWFIKPSSFPYTRWNTRFVFNLVGWRKHTDIRRKRNCIYLWWIVESWQSFKNLTNQERGKHKERSLWFVRQESSWTCVV